MMTPEDIELFAILPASVQEEIINWDIIHAGYFTHRCTICGTVKTLAFGLAKHSLREHEGQCMEVDLIPRKGIKVVGDALP